MKALSQSPDAASTFTIFALSRNIQSASAVALVEKFPAVKLVEGSLDDPHAIFARLETPIWGVFSVQNSMIRGSNNEVEERQGKKLVDAAIRHNVKHFVYISVDRHGARSDGDPTEVPHFANKYRIEKYLQEKAEAANNSMTWTILRPTSFMENFSSPLGPTFTSKVFAAVWHYAIPDDVALLLISVTDIGWFGAQAFLKSQAREYRNTALSLAADELTFNEASKICEEKTGFGMPATASLVAWAVLKVMSDIRVMFDWCARVRMDADISECRRLHPGMMTFGEWIEKESGFMNK